VRPLVVVVLHPQPHPLAGGIEAVKLRSHQKLLPDRLPEAFDLAEGHGMMRPALEVVDPSLGNGFPCGGVADFAGLCRDLPSEFVDFLWNHQALIDSGSAYRGLKLVSRNCEIAFTRQITERVQDRYNLSVPNVILRAFGSPTVPQNQRVT
jgi:hypothetical protein